MYLKRICVNNLLSFEHAELPLGGYTVIVGPNDSGKTNLLRILDTISSNENLEYLQLNRRHKLDPDEPSEITLTLDLDESEARMAFQCIFGRDGQIGAISKEMRTLDIVIFWGKDQLDMMLPKFTLYQFGSGFTIASCTSIEGIAFDIRGIFGSRTDYEREIDAWRAAESQEIFGPTIERFSSSRYDALENKKSFMDAILGGGRFASAAQCNVVTALPMSIRYNPYAVTPIVRLVKGRRYQDQFSTVPAGLVLNRIFEEGFTLVKEIYPARKELSNSLAALRNSHHAKYSNLLDTFKEISGGIEVLVELDGSDTEQILFVKDGKRYGIDDSASGYYALASILHLLLGKTSGLVAIDEPEIHLHPEMSSRLHNMLGMAALQDGIQIVVVTHSPRFVTHRQIKKTDESRLIMVTRQGPASQVHADTEESAPQIKPHLFKPEIFFGRGSMMVEGPSDCFVQRAISDSYGGLFEKHSIVLVDCGSKNNIPAQADLHRRFMIPYHCMADGDYDGDLDHVTKLEGDLEAELERMGVEGVKGKEDHRVYCKMINFLKKSKDEEWKKSGIWSAFERTVREVGESVPPQLNAGA